MSEDSAGGGTGGGKPSDDSIETQVPEEPNKKKESKALARLYPNMNVNLLDKYMVRDPSANGGSPNIVVPVTMLKLTLPLTSINDEGGTEISLDEDGGGSTIPDMERLLEGMEEEKQAILAAEKLASKKVSEAEEADEGEEELDMDALLAGMEDE